jgi:hypothetical protein
VAPAELLLWTSTTVVRAPLVEKELCQAAQLLVVEDVAQSRFGKRLCSLAEVPARSR